MPFAVLMTAMHAASLPAAAVDEQFEKTRPIAAQQPASFVHSGPASAERAASLAPESPTHALWQLLATQVAMFVAHAVQSELVLQPLTCVVHMLSRHVLQVAPRMPMIVEASVHPPPSPGFTPLLLEPPLELVVPELLPPPLPDPLEEPPLSSPEPLLDAPLDEALPLASSPPKFAGVELLEHATAPTSMPLKARPATAPTLNSFIRNPPRARSIHECSPSGNAPEGPIGRRERPAVVGGARGVHWGCIRLSWPDGGGASRPPCRRLRCAERGIERQERQCAGGLC